MTTEGREFVTIVSGLPRSGTSMMMRMLEAGGIAALTDDIRKADEDNPRGYYEFEAVKQTRKDDSWLSGAVGKSVKMVHLLLMDLPAGYEYRVLFMRRDLREVIASQDAMLQRQGKQSDGLNEEKMVALFEDQIQRVDQWVRERPHFGILHVNYNMMLATPDEPLGQINEFLGGNLDQAAMRAVVEPKLYRQRAES